MKQSKMFIDRRFCGCGACVVGNKIEREGERETEEICFEDSEQWSKKKTTRRNPFVSQQFGDTLKIQNKTKIYSIYDIIIPKRLDRVLQTPNTKNPPNSAGQHFLKVVQTKEDELSSGRDFSVNNVDLNGRKTTTEYVQCVHQTVSESFDFLLFPS